MNGTDKIIDLTILEALDGFQATPIRSSDTMFYTRDKTIIDNRIGEQEVNELVDMIRKISINFDVVYHRTFRVYVF